MAACPVCPSCSRPLTADRCAACGAAARAGPYQILSVLAQSPHGRTYRARGPGGLVALKELVFALVPTAQQLDAFEREARLLGSISHPQIPRLIDSFREGEGPSLRLYLAQELVEGEPLSARIGIDEAEARAIARQLLIILRDLHGGGIVHRDVKPANVLRRPDGTLALVDFGAARALAGVTHGATLVGTFGYMPPEQLGGTVDATSDLYALGATLVHLLGRKAPEDVLGPDLELRLDHLLISPAFRAFLGRLTALRRASRPGSAVEALRLLDAPPPRVRPSPARLLLALAAALVIGAGGVSFVAMLRTLGAAARSGAEAERARRAQLEALQRELTAPPKPAPAPAPDVPDHRDISLGRLLDGATLRELEPQLPSCYRRAGIELARVRLWPAQKALQLKIVLHSQDPACDWLPLEVQASAENARRLRRTGAHGDTPRDGWRELFYDFELPEGVRTVRLDLRGPTRALESWRIDLDGSGVKRAGYALAGRIGARLARIEVARPEGCSRLEGGTPESFWIEQDRDGGRRLQITVAFAARGDLRERCGQPARLVVLGARPGPDSTARLDSGRGVTFSVPVPQGRDRIRVALGGPSSRSALNFRIDLRSATVEPEALAAVIH
ncbi:MAG TPA: serine/threonine-protein kinase [Myxococcales bacterium]|nr:serine/threonine-protein kinase [Myxococcales bacterium]